MLPKITMAGNAVPFPCYIPSENIYTSQADELCHHYAHNFTGLPDYDMVVNNSVCNENRTICSTMGDAIFSMDLTNTLCGNRSIHFFINRTVMEGKDSNEICNLRNVSRCNSKQFQIHHK